MRKTLLVVAEDKDLVSVLAEIIRNSNFTVWEAVGAEEAIAICENTAVSLDLVLSDFQMRGMNGLDLAYRLTSIRPSLRIIVMSSDFSRLESISACGFEGIQKPFSFDDLVDRIKLLVSEESLLRQPILNKTASFG